MLSTSSHKNLEEFGKYLNIPIINGLSDQSHPCQVLSDLFSCEEAKGSISGKSIAWLGDGNNNMSNSLIEAAGKFDFIPELINEFGFETYFKGVAIKPGRPIMLSKFKQKEKLFFGLPGNPISCATGFRFLFIR